MPTASTICCQVRLLQPISGIPLDIESSYRLVMFSQVCGKGNSGLVLRYWLIGESRLRGPRLDLFKLGLSRIRSNPTVVNDFVTEPSSNGVSANTRVGVLVGVPAFAIPYPLANTASPSLAIATERPRIWFSFISFVISESIAEETSDGSLSMALGSV